MYFIQVAWGPSWASIICNIIHPSTFTFIHFHFMATRVTKQSKIQNMNVSISKSQLTPFSPGDSPSGLGRGDAVPCSRHSTSSCADLNEGENSDLITWRMMVSLLMFMVMIRMWTVFYQTSVWFLKRPHGCESSVFPPYHLDMLSQGGKPCYALTRWDKLDQDIPLGQECSIFDVI